MSGFYDNVNAIVMANARGICWHCAKLDAAKSVASFCALNRPL